VQLFSLGQIEISPGAQAALAATGASLSDFLARHEQGDWGEEADEYDRASSDWGLRSAHEIMSIFKLSDGAPLFVFTDGDRALTRVLIEEELESREVSAQEGYEIWARSYDDEQNPLITVEEPHVEQILVSAGSTITNKTRVLDFATGTGRYALKFARLGAVVTGIDPAPAMLARAQAAARREGLRIDFREGALDEGNALPFAEESFDLVVCALALSHMPSLRHTISELARVVARNGRLLITDTHPLLLREGVRTIIFRMGVRYVFPNTFHPPADITAAVEAAGLAVREVVDIPMSELPPNSLWNDLRAAGSEKPFGFILLAEK
jgi:ubiquinone/menaquinone biosynthesis C-methylase UbiE